MRRFICITNINQPLQDFFLNNCCDYKGFSGAFFTSIITTHLVILLDFCRKIAESGKSWGIAKPLEIVLYDL